MRVIDFMPYVIEALRAGPLNQTDLTEAVWGGSGRNAAPLVNLLNHMVGRRQIVRRQSGRAKVYSLVEGAEAQALVDAKIREQVATHLPVLVDVLR